MDTGSELAVLITAFLQGWLELSPEHRVLGSCTVPGALAFQLLTLHQSLIPTHLGFYSRLLSRAVDAPPSGQPPA